jgi:hypothetical protein
MAALLGAHAAREAGSWRVGEWASGRVGGSSSAPVHGRGLGACLRRTPATPATYTRPTWSPAPRELRCVISATASILTKYRGFDSAVCDLSCGVMEQAGLPQ